MTPPQILIVDDELDMRIFMRTLLETSGYAPITERDGKAGFEKALEIRPNLIILDVMMPGEGGVQMYRKLRTHVELGSLPVIMLSAVGESAFAHYLKMLNTRLPKPIAGPDAYLEKPPDPDLVLTTINDLLGRKNEP